ncbi:MAG: N-acetylmuramic acid 6-phosphate etherase, partial [Planctomycetota bacterium]
AGGSLVLCGAGTSGRLAVAEAAECPPTFRSRPEQVRALIAGGRPALGRAIEGAEDDEAAGRSAVQEDGVGAGDVFVGISASGSAPFVRAALAEAARRGAHTALLTCNPLAARHEPPLAHETIVLEVGPELLAGSSRLKAGTATKIALNALSTAAFSRLGKVYGALMVDVHATNRKLRARARRLVCRLAQVQPARAEALLRAVDWRVKDAVVMARLGVGPAEAARRLAAAGGRLREVIG